MSLGWIPICHSGSEKVSGDATADVPSGSQGPRPRDESWYPDRNRETCGDHRLPPVLEDFQVALREVWS